MIVDATDPDTHEQAIEAAAKVVREGKVVVLPTDTVYGVGADAFDQVAVAMVLAAKHRSRDVPPPVLVPSTRTVDGLGSDVPMYAKILIRHFWPGALTVVVRAQPSLAWDLGETNGTVALRMPDDLLTLLLLTEVGPMAVTSANRTGQPPATTAEEAQGQLGGAVSLYLDGGPRTDSAPSTIVDCTGAEPVVLRHGAIPADRLREVLGTTVLHDAPPSEAAPSEAVPTAAVSDGLPEGEALADGRPGDERAAGEPTDREPTDGEGADSAAPVVDPLAAIVPRSSGLPVRADALRAVPAPDSLQ
ncbi:threonylcarbamoyl-AMP synthase [Ornithinimicrobium ciconiae]|uniref:L-threonylcarbamoyladenylate synthase n=1 Tax=Ornithinimicrobium ciconiae TaxID=2594265 RepID=A0A516GDT1_9MICO|nr:L-threonylcarbamoyladenylate synthase [Ornithinimicrobium ciconiae]QDO89679.1 threonylcarbamoyl-AMP synthase [Ornithinimicrobium ciconiae]